MSTACVAHAAGDLRVEEVDDRTPGPLEVAVTISHGGICGSDLHYWRHGRVGDFALRAPLVLGHEVVGELAGDLPGLERGTPVAIHPATVCGRCRPCRAGRRNLCEEVRYLGSAARNPHVQGGFRRTLIVPADQVVALPAGLTPIRAVLAEPLAVAVHAVHRAGDVLGRDVLVTGAGPIGVLVAAVARAAGAASVVVTDLVPHALAVARSVGATDTLLLSDGFTPGPDSVDVAIEASGSPQALGSALTAVRRGGAVVLVGMLPPGEVPVAATRAIAREIDLRGSFRFDPELRQALRLLAEGLPVDNVVTEVRPLSGALDAFALAADASRSCKVLLDMSQ